MMIVSALLFGVFEMVSHHVLRQQCTPCLMPAFLPVNRLAFSRAIVKGFAPGATRVGFGCNFFRAAVALARWSSFLLKHIAELLQHTLHLGCSPSPGHLYSIRLQQHAKLRCCLGQGPNQIKQPELFKARCTTSTTICS
eukprot:SAG31_NODE_2596_length_5420_cov_45.220330_6_plen_139_part_00